MQGEKELIVGVECKMGRWVGWCVDGCCAGIKCIVADNEKKNSLVVVVVSRVSRVNFSRSSLFASKTYRQSRLAP